MSPKLTESADERRQPWTRRVAAGLFLFVGLLLIAVLAARSLLGPWSGQSDLPVVRESEPKGVLPSQRAEASRQHGKPLDVEIRLDEGSLLIANKARGRCSLGLTSRRFGRPVKARCRIVAGPAAPFACDVLGNSRVDGLREGEQWLEVQGPGSLMTERLISLRPKSRRELRIDWERQQSLRGRVFSSQGTPIENAVLLMAGKEARTNDQGEFRLDAVVAGSWLPIRISAKGHASALEVLTANSHTGVLQGLRFVLQPGITVKGQVQIPTEERQGVRLYLLPRRLGQPGSFPFFWPDRYSDIELDAKGFFSIDGLRTDLPVMLGLLHPRYYLAQATWIDLGQKTRLAHVTTNLFPRRGKRLEGKVWGVEDGERKELAGVRLSAADSREGAWGLPYKLARRGAALAADVAELGTCRSVSDRKGHYVLALPGKQSTVFLQKDGYLGQRLGFGRRAVATWDFTMKPGESSADPEAEPLLELRFRAAPGSRRSSLPQLRITLKWNGELLEQPFLHDASKVLVHRLTRAAVVKLRWRFAGGEFEGKQLNVIGRTPLVLGLPSR